MSFHKCPECGETNYAENSRQQRTFDCGFVGWFGTRSHRCKAKKARPTQVALPAEVARYRLAFLDAAQAAETIAFDMEADGASSGADRCRALARQMREFAGHSTAGPSPGVQPSNGHALARFLPKIWSR